MLPRSSFLLLLLLVLLSGTHTSLLSLKAVQRRSSRGGSSRRRRARRMSNSMPSETDLPDPGPTQNPNPQNTPACFPASAKVETFRGSLSLQQLRVGDIVRSAEGWTSVFMFTHADASGNFDFIEITVSSEKMLRLSAGHFVLTNRGGLPARALHVGDRVFTANGTSTTVVTLANVRDRGLFNPQTTHGTIVVEGIQTSTFTEAVPSAAAVALLAPLRASFVMFGIDLSRGFVSKPGAFRDSLLALSHVF